MSSADAAAAHFLSVRRLEGGVMPAGGTRGQQPPANAPQKLLTKLHISSNLLTPSSQMFLSAPPLTTAGLFTEVPTVTACTEQDGTKF